MSNSLAIAGVTRMIQLMIQEYAEIDVTTKSPDRAAADGQGARVNLFLYHTMPNPSWRNLDIPGRGGRGERGNPPLALNLYYLLTAYGEEGTNLADQTRLGAAMQVLHDRPIIKRSTIEEFGNQEVLDSELQDQIEHVRIAPDTLNIEEMSRLWTTFQTQYRVSAAYQASVVLIESQRPVRSAMPVVQRGEKDRGVNTDVALDAVLESIEYREEALQPELPAANVGSTIRVLGRNLPTVDSSIVIRDPRRSQTNDADIVARLTPKVEEPGAQLSAELSEEAGLWSAGLLSLELEFGKNGRRSASNALPLRVAPEVQTGGGENSAIAFAEEVGDQRRLTVSLAQPLGDNRRVLLILNALNQQASAGDDAAFFQIPQIADDSASTNLTPTFDITAVPPGTYWIRIRVDGVDSLAMIRSRDQATNRWLVSLDNNQRVIL